MRRPVLSSIAIAKLLISAAVVTLAAGCQVKGDLNGQFSCVEDPTCPSGMECKGGFCVESNGGDGGVDPAGECATVDQLATSFDGNMLPPWADTYFQAGGTLAVTGGDLVMNIPANMSKSRAQISSSATYDLRDKSITLEVPKVGGETTEVGLFDTSGGEAYFGMTGGEIFVHSKGRFIQGSKQPYNAAKHRWWRVRTEALNAIWETSSDGTNWDAWTTDTAPLDFAWIKLELSIQGKETGQTADSARWGSINLGADAAVKWCPLASWNESMTDNVLSPHSDYYGNDCMVRESEGTLKISANVKPTYCTAYSTRPVDATNATYAFPVQAAPEPGYTRIALIDKGDRNIVSMYSDNQLHFYVEANDRRVIDDAQAFNPVTETHWRIVLSAGNNISFETSSDGVNWNRRQAVSAPALEANAMYMERTVFTDDSGNTNLPTTATFGARIR